MGDLLRDVTEVETKVLGLARAIPAAGYDWRPGKGVRSTGEVFIHVAADNYFLPAAMGVEAPKETGISGKDYTTVAAFEKRTMTRDQIIAELEKSFAFLKKAITDTPDAKLDAPLEVFGQKMNYRRLVDFDCDASARAPGTAHRVRAQQQRDPAVEQRRSLRGISACSARAKHR